MRGTKGRNSTSSGCFWDHVSFQFYNSRVIRTALATVSVPNPDKAKPASRSFAFPAYRLAKTAFDVGLWGDEESDQDQGLGAPRRGRELERPHPPERPHDALDEPVQTRQFIPETNLC